MTNGYIVKFPIKVNRKITSFDRWRPTWWSNVLMSAGAGSSTSESTFNLPGLLAAGTVRELMNYAPRTCGTEH
jgi:hypothetical protein